MVAAARQQQAEQLAKKAAAMGTGVRRQSPCDACSQQLALHGGLPHGMAAGACAALLATARL